MTSKLPDNDRKPMKFKRFMQSCVLDICIDLVKCTNVSWHQSLPEKATLIRMRLQYGSEKKTLDKLDFRDDPFEEI